MHTHIAHVPHTQTHRRRQGRAAARWCSGSPTGGGTATRARPTARAWSRRPVRRLGLVGCVERFAFADTQLQPPITQINSSSKHPAHITLNPLALLTPLPSPSSKPRPPGGKLVVQYQKKPTQHPKCGATGVVLHGVSAGRSVGSAGSVAVAAACSRLTTRERSS